MSKLPLTVYDSVWLQSFILTQLSSTMIKNHCDLYSSFTCEKKSRHLYSVFFPFLFFLLSSVTQMLTTQADRFSAEEVHCSPPAHANYHHYNSFVSVGELNWKKKIQGWTSSWRPPASTSDTFSCKKKQTKNPWVNHLNPVCIKRVLWAVWGKTSDKSGVNVSLSVA